MAGAGFFECFLDFDLFCFLAGAVVDAVLALSILAVEAAIGAVLLAVAGLPVVDFADDAWLAIALPVALSSNAIASAENNFFIRSVSPISRFFVLLSSIITTNRCKPRAAA